ncbi:hypothetical protein GR925_19240 [Streptomyces sp. HUCO-GS316]|uniref:hypothetical protein n=1 Tax=Streptomyces sp. HUCO-GS316 TaxID=2692198 RepID=UPI001367C117|nr:hypothetical protein [Streptomyces sp. HUCO-GS316]MXM65529.1 hypothetical protein [Streptomyces sp. HUCO-GS316]
MKSTRCATHRPNADFWHPACVRCGVRLLDQNLSPAQLLERLRTVDPETPVVLTGRQRGTWVEVVEEGDFAAYAYWVRPASNTAGFEAIEHPSDNPTGEELSRAFFVEMLSAPGDARSTGVTDLPEIGTAWSRPKPSRWERFKRWSRANAEREFVTIAAPMTCIWLVALGWVLGWDGMSALAGLLVGWLF